MREQLGILNLILSIAYSMIRGSSSGLHARSAAMDFFKEIRIGVMIDYHTHYFISFVSRLSIKCPTCLTYILLFTMSPSIIIPHTIIAHPRWRNLEPSLPHLHHPYHHYYASDHHHHLSNPLVGSSLQDPIHW